MLGGLANTTCTACSVVVGGWQNRVDAGVLSLVGGGCGNRVSEAYSAITGGRGNCTLAQHSFIGTGQNNCILAAHSNASILGSGLTSLSGNMLHAALLSLSGIPTIDPGVVGVVWRSGTDLKISTG